MHVATTTALETPVFNVTSLFNIALSFWKVANLKKAASFIFLLMMGCACQWSLAAPAISFGVMPFLPPTQLERQFRAFSVKLGEELQTSVQFRTRKSYQEFTAALQTEQFDIALIQPLDYLAIRENTRYTPLVRKKDSLQGIFVVVNAEITSLTDLRGKRIAFPAQQAAVTHLAEEKLRAVGLTTNDYEGHYHEDYPSCLQAIQNKSAEACVIAQVMSQALKERRSKRYTIIDTTDFMAPILVVIGPKLYPERERLQRWFMSLNDSETGAALLNSTYLETVVSTSDSEYTQPSVLILTDDTATNPTDITNTTTNTQNNNSQESGGAH